MSRAVICLLAAALTLADARALADQRNASLAASRAELDVARAGVDAAGQLPNPTFSASYGEDDPKLQLGLDIRLPFLGQRSAAVGSASALLHVAQAEAEVSKVSLHAQVRRSFAARWAALQQEQIAAQSTELASRLAKFTEEKFRIGQAPQLEVEQARLAAQKAAHDQKDRDAEAEATGRELQAVLGAPVPGEPGAPADTDVPVVAALLDRSRGHPEIAALRFQEEAAKARVHEEKIANLPLPVLTVTAEHFVDQTPAWGARLGIAFDLPLLSLNGGKIAQEEQSARKASLLAQAQLQKIEGQLSAARAHWAAAAERAKFYGGDYLASASRVVEMSEAGYRIGKTALINVLQAQADLAAARSRSIDAVLDAQRALADLEEALGADL
jgi:cobalt-zinc-cadmium efflux system outer membrane protein